jgi:cephalosporin hydroxylase
MKKTIISYNSYQKLRAKWQKEIGSNSKVHKLSNKLYTSADKHNYTYLFSWNNEPLLQTPEDLIALQEIISKQKPEVIIS